MSNIDIIRAWKDKEFRSTLSEQELSKLPENPAGLIELSDEELSALSGGAKPVSKTCCACTHHCAVMF